MKMGMGRGQTQVGRSGRGAISVQLKCEWCTVAQHRLRRRGVSAVGFVQNEPRR